MRKLYFLLFSLFFASNVFSQSNYTILGSAQQIAGCNCFQLTCDCGDEHGAFFQNHTINLNSSFDFTFGVYLGSNGAGSHSADGICFVLTTNPNGLGATGEGLGYGSNPPPGSQPCSFGIEFDTWKNGSPANDPDDHHTAFEANGHYDHNVASPVSATPGGGTMADGNWHTVRITWDVASQTMTDYFDGSLRISKAMPGFVGTYLCGNPVVNWGWSGSTGGGHNLQKVCTKNISTWTAGVNFESCLLPVQFTDISTSFAGSIASWAWTFGDGATSNLQNPLHTYASFGSYNAMLTITDVNGCVDTSSHVVTIAPPIVITPTLQDPPCNGGSNGNINTTPSGGFGPAAGLGGYYYEWNNNPLTNNPNLVGVPAGTYTVSVTDGICSTTAQYTLNQPPPVVASVSHVDAPCGGTGSANIIISGGTPGYTNAWSGTFSGVFQSFPGTNVSGLVPHLYNANPTDAHGCSSLLTYSVTIGSLPCGYTLSTSSVNVNCFGLSTGSVTLTVTGGVPTSISWVNAGTGANVGSTATVSGLPAGTYNYTWTDAANTFTGSVVVSGPGSAMASHLNTVNISCGGNSDGQATVSVDSGGVSPYSYNWSPAHPNNPVVSGLGAGAISVTVTDANLCTSLASGNITAPPTLNVAPTGVNNACNQFNSGWATANATGGNSPYTYYWSNISSADTDLSLPAGTYQVTVTDHRLCTATGSITITTAPPLTYTKDSTNIACFGGSTGSITITASGGTPAYTYTWNPATVTGGTPTGLAAGTYLLTLTDANSCAILDSFKLTQPAAALTATSSHTDVTCFGANNGTVTVTIAGGTAPYSFQGTAIPTAGTDTIKNLPPATYAGNLTDANGCLVALSETVTSPGAQSLTLNHVDDTCFHGNNGTATALFVNATGLVTYNWSGGLTGANITSLVAGTYTLTAIDANNCTQNGTVTVIQPAIITMPLATLPASCFGGNGTATGTPAGTAPITFAWSGSALTTSSVPLPAGAYTVTSTDAGQCQETASFSITQPSDITIQIAQTNINCFDSATGTINLTVGGGTGPNYTFAWNPNVSTTNSASALTAGPYHITVTDQNSCPKDTLVTLTQPALSVSAVVVADSIPCFGQNNGSITLTTTGGTPAYSYVWLPNVSTTNSAVSLSPGNYAVTVSDINSCTASYSALITQPLAALTLNPAQKNLTCYHNNSGVAVANAAGGSVAYNYNWSPNVSTSDSALGIAAGIYGLTVTDSHQCTATASYIITEPAQLTAAVATVNVLCNGQSTGSISLTPSGGTGADTYTWSPNVSTTNSATALAAGNYLISITDANNCQLDTTIAITQPPLLTDTSVVIDVACNGQSNGSITVLPTGGVSPYSYTITANSTPITNSTGQFTGLAQATYAVVITDNNSCTYNSSVTVNQPPVLADSLASVNPSCFHYANGQIVVVAVGGVPNYTYSFSNGTGNTTGIATGLAAGPYSVTVNDANNCIKTDSTVLTQPDSVLIEVMPTPVTAKLGVPLQINTTTNQSLSVSYLWTPDFGLSCYDCPDPVFNGVYSQVYNVVVTNQNSCIGTSRFEVTVIPNYDLFFPNAFTPGTGGANAFWQIYGNLSAVKQMEIAVFNRIGEKVFESNDVNFKWDGTFKGGLAPEGVYIYAGKFVWLNNHSNDTFKGSITLLR